MEFSFADFYTLMLVVFTAVATYMTYESRAREMQFTGFLSAGLVTLVYALPVSSAPVFNQAYFHFSGVVGNIVVAALMIAIFVEPVRRGTDYACRNWLYKDVLDVIKTKG